MDDYEIRDGVLATFLRQRGCTRVQGMDEVSWLLLMKEVTNRLISRFLVGNEAGFSQVIGDVSVGGIRETLEALKGAEDTHLLRLLAYGTQRVEEGNSRPDRGFLHSLKPQYEAARNCAQRDFVLVEMGRILGLVDQEEWSKARQGIALAPATRARIFEVLYFGYDVDLSADIPLVLRIFDYAHLGDMYYKVRRQFEGYELIMTATYLEQALCIGIGSALIPAKEGVLCPRRGNFPYREQVVPHSGWFRGHGQWVRFLETLERIESLNDPASEVRVWSSAEVEALRPSAGWHVIDNEFLIGHEDVFGRKEGDFQL